MCSSDLLGFVLLVARYLKPDFQFNEKVMRTGFWTMNIGLVLMIAISLLPIGLFQVSASISEGLWYARSESFLQQDFLQTLRWLRTIGDIILIFGAVLFAYQVTKLTFSRRNS